MKLFRGIRQTTILKGNIKKYLLYAIGEILLVMIGISLAFQVSNWDDNRIKKNSEIRYYENIRDQISDDKSLIEQQLQFNNGFMTQFRYANNILNTNDRSRIDSLGLIILNLTQYSDFDGQGNIYETLVNSGEIKLLGNYEIMDGIRELEEKYIYLNRMENIHYDAVMTYVIPATSPILNFSTGTVQQPDLLYNYKFQNLVFSLINIMTEKNKAYDEALNQIDLITALIDDELNHR